MTWRGQGDTFSARNEMRWMTRRAMAISARPHGEVFDGLSARVEEWAGGFSDDELVCIAEGRRMFNASVVSSDAGGSSASVFRGTAGDVGSTPVYRHTTGVVGSTPTSVYRGTAGDVWTRERERWISALVEPGRHSSTGPSTLYSYIPPA